MYGKNLKLKPPKKQKASQTKEQEGTPPIQDALQKRVSKHRRQKYSAAAQKFKQIYQALSDENRLGLLVQ
ncbi:hypothetical protein NHP190002_15400 [Helicobacter ailurogastricus]|nr:hypothetical protein ASB7_04270 [Helicobacter ailurogastricus]GMB90811.1 hypothetical protein NHP190002_15400 [Helicobacter ailurogastricus]